MVSAIACPTAIVTVASRIPEVRWSTNAMANPSRPPAAAPASSATRNCRFQLTVAMPAAYPPTPISAACATENWPDEIVTYSPSVTSENTHAQVTVRLSGMKKSTRSLPDPLELAEQAARTGHEHNH